MNSTERRALFSLSSIYALRMLGLFMIFPVFSLYADGLEGTTPLLIGLAISIYGLTQAILQIPFGMLSDRFGRKPIIVFGLLLFAAGSVVAACSETIYGVLLGRALQGSGAIAAAIMAMAADLTRESQRTKIMASIGASIGASFIVAMVLGPVLSEWIGVPGMFWLIAASSLLAILVVIYVVPVAEHVVPVASNRANLKTAISNAVLLRLDFSIFLLHALLSACFVVFPLLLRDSLQVAPSQHWLIYFPVLVGTFVCIVPLIILSEKRGKTRPLLLATVALMALAQLLLSGSASSLEMALVGLTLFFVAFNFMEATFPSLVSKTCPAEIKGVCMGVYGSSQFFGVFVGGALGGYLMGEFGHQMIFYVGAGACVVWFLVLLGLPSSPVKALSETAVDEQDSPAQKAD